MQVRHAQNASICTLILLHITAKIMPMTIPRRLLVCQKFEQSTTCPNASPALHSGAVSPARASIGHYRHSVPVRAFLLCRQSGHYVPDYLIALQSPDAGGGKCGQSNADSLILSHHGGRGYQQARDVLLLAWKAV